MSKYIDEASCLRQARRNNLTLDKEGELYSITDDNYRDGEPIFEGTLSMIFSYLQGFEEGKHKGFSMKGNNNG